MLKAGVNYLFFTFFDTLRSYSLWIDWLFNLLKVHPFFLHIRIVLVNELFQINKIIYSESARNYTFVFYGNTETI